MPLFFPKPPFPRPQNLSIYTQFTLHKSLKNYPKHVKTLRIESRLHQPHLPKSLLKRLQSRVKSLQALNVGRHQQLFDSKVPEVLTFIKSFNKIQSLTLFGDIHKCFSHDSYLKWLTESRKLTHLTFANTPNSYESYAEQSGSDKFSLLESIQVKYEKNLKHTKLLSYVLKSRSAIKSSCSESDLITPSSLRSLSIIPRHFLFSFHINLSHLHNLSILHLNFPIPFNDFLDILHSLPTSDQLTHLTVYIAKVPDYIPRYALKIAESLKYFRSLRSLDLGTESFLFVSALLESLPSPSNLHQLTLNTLILDEKQLKQLARFIEKFSSLSFLCIKNIKSIQGETIDGHRLLFNAISGLPKLKSLEIDLEKRSPMSLPNYTTWNGCLGEFARCVKRLPELSEISFAQSEVCHRDELELFADVLKEKGSNLKKLKITLKKRDRGVDHLEKLNKVFSTLKNLEDLCLEELKTSKESFLQFIDLLSELKWLRSVKLDGEGPDLNKADRVRTVKKILMKYGLEEFNYFGDYPVEEGNNNEELNCIDIKEVLSKNPRLFSVKCNPFGSDKTRLVFNNVHGFLP